MRSSRLQAALWFLFWAFVFGVSYTQARLYYSNQNQYFLHGLAAAGRGDLHNDWLANTLDPTPVFSALVAVTASFLHEGLFYLYYILIQGLYFYCLVGIFDWLAKDRAGKLPRLLFLTLVIVVHAGITRYASAQLFGVDYPWYLQAGLAAQYLLGFGLQPSTFGVLLLASVLAFLRGHPWYAVLCACLAAVLHGTYLPTAAFLTLAFMLAQRRFDKAILLGLFAFILVAPTVIYNIVTFAPSTASTFSDFVEAQRILAHMRIPHHAEVSRWFDGIALAQVLWVVAAIFLVRRTPLFTLMLLPFSCSLALTLLQVTTDNDTLALLFPWRTSVLLVPLATAVILSQIVLKAAPVLERLQPARGKLFMATCVVAILSCVVGGVVIWLGELGYRTNPAEQPLLAFVAKNHRTGDRYLLPVDLPKQGTGARGAFSTNFMPPPRLGKAGDLIAIDLQQFRLATGTPIFVDFKAIPYKETEVVEWWQRVLWCRQVYVEAPLSVDQLGAALADRQITHVVAPATRTAPFDGLGAPLYADDAYCVYRVSKN